MAERDYDQMVRDAEEAAALHGRSLARSYLGRPADLYMGPSRTRGRKQEGYATQLFGGDEKTTPAAAAFTIGTSMAPGLGLPTRIAGRVAAPALGALATMLLPDEAQARFKAVTGLGGRATAAEITRAAKGSAGLSQPELRNLYRELGLTGQQPAPLVMPSLQSQPAEAIAEATKLKMADRAALDTLSPKQRLRFQEGEKIPGFMLPSQEAAQAGKEAFAPLKKEITSAEKAFDASARQGNIPSVFDLSVENLRRMSDVDQFPLPRAEPKITERLAPAFEGGGGLRRVERAARQAFPRDWWWYNIQEPLGTFPQILGSETGPQAARTWVDALAGTSMVNPIESNVRGSSYYLGNVMRGEPLPQSISLADPTSGKTVKALAGAPPAGYGAKAQIQHADRVREYLANLADPVSNPKPFSYRQNLGGNYAPRTIDTHDIRNMIGMPRALETFGEEGALLPGEYAALEGLGQRAATRAGMPQAAQQGATWIGGAQYTGLKSQPIPLADVLNRRTQVTAAVRGISPEQAWVEHVKGIRPLLAGAPAVPLGVAAASQDQQ